MTAGLAENLIQFVNIIGSIFYGVILGIFFVAFFMKWVSGNAVFIAAIIAEAIIISIYNFGNIAFLWLNPIGCGLVMLLAMLLNPFVKKPKPTDLLLNREWFNLPGATMKGSKQVGLNYSLF